MHQKKNIILSKSFEFALEIIRFCEELEGERKFVVANQLLKSGTSIGAQIREAQNAESKADFIHKFKIAVKEVEETQYWLLLIEKGYNKTSASQLLILLEEIKKIISKIIISCKAVK